MFDDLFKDTKIKSLNPLALGASGDRVRCFMQKNNQKEDMAPFRGEKNSASAQAKWKHVTMLFGKENS